MNVVRIGEIKNPYWNFGRKWEDVYEGKDNFKTDAKGLWVEYACWIHVAQHGVRWRVLLNMAKKL